jgi:hypothetical protein
MIIGELINEGNEDGLFGFVTVESHGDSNILPNTQFIDEIETDAPVPFNVPIEFDGEPRYGDHDITITVRYKDSIRDEIFLTHDQTVFLNEPSNTDDESTDPTMIVVPILLVIAAAIYIIRRRKKASIKAS